MVLRELPFDSHREDKNYLATEHTEDTENIKMGKEYLSTIWPVLYFEADWPSKSYNFDLGVQLIRAEKPILDEITEFNTNCWNANPTGRINCLSNTNWFLAMRRPQVHESIPVSEKGVSFVDNFQSSIVDSFRMCLQLVRSTEAISPFKFPAEIHEESIDAVDTISDDFEGINSDKPDVYLPEIFEIGDLQLLTDLWSVLIKLRKLDFWSRLVTKEEFFAACDKKAGEKATEKMIDFLKSNPAYLEVSEEDRKRWASSFSETEWWKEYYKESFQKVFLEKQEEMFSNRTRVGRALNLFFKGIQLPLLHSFLSICLTLETIFTVEEAEITYQFATRLANITGKTFEQRKDIFERARKVYKERSNIVHGRKSIETVEPDVLKDAFYFARHSLQHILLDSRLLELYSAPITIDKTKISDKAVEAIKSYFRDLDLR